MKKGHLILIIAAATSIATLALALWLCRSILYISNAEFQPGSMEFFICHPPGLLQKLVPEVPRERVTYFVFGEGFYVSGVTTHSEREKFLAVLTQKLVQSGRNGPSFDFADGSQEIDQFYARYGDYYVRFSGDRFQVFHDRNG